MRLFVATRKGLFIVEPGRWKPGKPHFLGDPVTDPVEHFVRELDRALPSMLDALREDDLLFITADHGNDPTTPSTDHARECVPLLVLGPAVRPVDLGVLNTFSDLGATISDWFAVPFAGAGRSFLPTLLAH